MTSSNTKGDSDPLKIGLALGSGGAKGLAHVLMLEALEESGLQPFHIAGSSIGAVLGALYSGGYSCAEIREVIDRYFVAKDDSPLDFLFSEEARKWANLVDVDLGEGGLLNGERLVKRVYKEFDGRAFDDLSIPMSIVAADLWSGETHILDSGSLLPAIEASMAIPGVFNPVVHQGRTLVDGGAVNPVPFDILPDDCDLVIAIDVSGNRDDEDGDALSSMGVLLQSFQIMSYNILAAKLRHERPEVYIKPDIRNVKMLEFYKARQVFEQAQPAQPQLVKLLNRSIRGHRGSPGCSTA